MERLDHVVINVLRDMDAAASMFQALGFNLTPRGYHTLGSINHLVVSGSAYLEIVGVPEGGRQRAEVLESPLGLSGLVFQSDDIDRTHARLREAGVEPADPIAFSRPVSLGEEERDARFRTVKVPASLFPAGRVYYCQHLTPELVWRPEWQSHPNGFLGFEQLTVAGPDPDADARLYARAADSGVRETPEGPCVPCEGIELRFIPADEPGFARLTLRFASLDELEKRANAAGIDFERTGGDIARLRLPALSVELECRIAKEHAAPA